MNKKLFTFFEIIVWMVLFLVPMFFISTLLNPDLDIQKHYSADFRDVNGIIVGSPVNYIGYNVGHVHDVQILPDRVRVDIAIVKKDYSLPKCSIVKVEESGIGGSRSLEIFPCKNPLMKNGIHTQQPKRVADMLDDACIFVKSLTQSMGNLLNLLQINLDGGDGSNLQELKRASVTAQIELKQTNANLDKVLETSPRNIQKTKNNIQKTLNIVKGVHINTDDFKNTTIQNQKNLDKLNKKLKKYTAAEYKEKAQKLYWKTEVMTIIDKNKLQQDMTKFNNALKSSQSMLNNLEASVKSESLKETCEKVKEINDNTKNLIEKD